MKGAAGRISIAISVLLMGGVGLWGSIASIPLQPDAFYLEKVEGELDRLPTGDGVGEMPAEAAALLRRIVAGGLRLWRDLWAMPAIRMTVWLSVALNASSVIAGAGWLFAKPWAATLGLWQAMGFLPFAVWSWWPVDLALTRMRELVLEANAGAAGLEQARAWLSGAQTALLWTNTLMLLGWNGFLVWYFLRATRARHV